MPFDDDGLYRGLFQQKPEKRPILLVESKGGGKKTAHMYRVGGIVVSITVVLITIILLWYGVRYSHSLMFSNNEMFRVKELNIETHGRVVTRPFVQQCIPIDVGTNLFAVDIGAMQEDFLKRTPSVKDIYISRRLPATVDIEVWERVPVAWLSREAFLAMDREGHVFRFPSPNRRMPLITGAPNKTYRPGERVEGLYSDALAVVDACDAERLGNAVDLWRIDLRQEYAVRPNAVKLQLTGGEIVDLWWDRKNRSSAERLSDVRGRLQYLATLLRDLQSRGQRGATFNLTLDDYMQNNAVTLREG